MVKPYKVWEVFTSNLSLLTIRATDCSIVEGHLIFEGPDGTMIRAVAPGYWESVRLVAEEELKFIKQMQAKSRVAAIDG